MKLKYLLLKTMTLFMALYLSSCTLEPYIITNEELYTRNFIKKFGLIDPNQDFNLAQAATVNVNVGDGARSVKVYVKVENKYYLVANLTNVTGRFDVPIDIPEGCDDLMVKIDGVRYYTTVGGLVSRQLSRSISESPESNQDIVISWADPILFNVMQVSPIITDGRWIDYVNGEGELRINSYPDSDPLSQGLVPEGHNGSGLANYENPYIVKDFYFYGVDAGKTGSERKGITIYPMYWQTSSTHVVGLYYFVDGDGNYVQPGTEGAEMRTVEIFTDKNSDEDIGSEQLQVSKTNLTTYTNCGKLSKGDSVNQLIMNANNLTDVSQISTLYKTDSGGNPVEGEMWGSKYKYLTEEACLNIVNYLKNNNDEDATFKVDQGTNYTYGEIFNCSAQVWGDGIDLWFNYTNNYSAAGSTLAYTPNQDCAVMAKGINIKVPSDMYFGLYICTVDDKRYGNLYSQKEFNTSEFHTGETAATWTADESREKPIMSGQSFAATYKHQSSGRQFFSFEDAYDKTDDWDLNDIVFRMDGSYQTFTTDTNSKVEWATKDKGKLDEPLSWIVAAEDLGTTDDFDFNDIVFKLTCITVNGEDSTAEIPTFEKSLVVQALAAGGTKAIYLHFVDDGNYDWILSPNNRLVNTTGMTSADAEECEWHRWFGNYPSTKMINTSTDNYLSQDTKYCQITESMINYTLSGFSIASYSSATPAYGRDAMTVRGFYITVDSPLPNVNGMGAISVSTTDNTTVIYNKDAGIAPQMFLIPNYHEDEKGWKWPDERTSIFNAYPKFGNWVTSSEDTWYKFPSSGVYRITPNTNPAATLNVTESTGN